MSLLKFLLGKKAWRYLRLILVCLVVAFTIQVWQTHTRNPQDDNMIQLLNKIDRKLVKNKAFDVVEKPKDSATKGLLLSYMRAGTTFVGSPFGRNEDIFYFFEPEWAFYFTNLNEYSPLMYLDGSVRDPVWMEHPREPVKELMENFLRCNFTGIDIASLKSRFHQESIHLFPFFKCVRQPKADLKACVKNITQVCKSKNIRFAKTVRLRMEIAEDLMRADPTLRVIHLLRDPRGIAVSRLSWSEVYRASSAFTIGRVCAEILRDIETVENMPSELSDRVIPVLYEDIADNPDVMFQSLYSFVKIHQSESVKEFVRNITRGKSDASKGGFNTQRANSSRTAQSWRSKIAWNLCVSIDRMCGRVYDKIGVIRAKNEKTLRNYNVSLRLHPNHKDTYMYNFRKFL